MKVLSGDDDPLELIRYNKVTEILKKLGYKILVFPINHQTGFADGDMEFKYKKNEMTTRLNDFYLFLLENSMLKFIHEHIANRADYREYFRDSILYIFQKLEKVAVIKGPKFVFVYIKCPHYPFVFGENGQRLKPGHITDIVDKKYYLGQYKYIGGRIIKLIDMLLEKSADPPIVVIQSDHGQRGSAPGNGQFRLKVGNDWRDILNTYYLPGFDYKLLHDAISPMKTFDLIFSYYFKEMKDDWKMPLKQGR